MLGPAILGTVGFARLWQGYAALIGPGLFSAAGREMASLAGRDDEAGAVKHLSYLVLVVATLYLLGGVSWLALRPGALLGSGAARLGFVAAVYAVFAGVPWAVRR